MKGIHSQLQYEKNTEINTISVMNETGRNMHFYSDIWTQTNCIYSNQHVSATLSNYYLSVRIVSTERFLTSYLSNRIFKVKFKNSIIRLK